MQEQDNLSDVSPFASGRGRKSQVRPQALSDTKSYNKYGFSAVI